MLILREPPTTAMNDLACYLLALLLLDECWEFPLLLLNFEPELFGWDYLLFFDITWLLKIILA